VTEAMIKDIIKFERVMGYPCNLDEPETHNQRVMAKKYKDRNPLLTLTADKIRVKEYADERIPGNGLFDHRVFASTDMGAVVKHITGNTVLKMNNASGRNMFFYFDPHRDEGGDSIAAVEKMLRLWWDMPYGKDKGEWCYEDIKPGAVIEAIIFESAHDNYRFLCFRGEPHYVHVHNYSLYPEGHSSPKVNYCSTYDMDWQLQDVKYKKYSAEPCRKPKQFDEMREMCRALAEPFDFVRIDFMVSGGHIFLSELTHYPVSGKCKLSPLSFDYKLGKLW
jgi:hypothetical protein